MATNSTVIAVSIGAAGLVIAAVIVAAALVLHDRAAPAASVSAIVEPVVTALPAPPTLQERMETMSFTRAFQAAKPEMGDSTDAEDPGMAVFAIWAAAHLQWNDVAVTTDETTNALALKDSDEARGKRLCTSGSIAQITIDKSVAPLRLAVGQFMTGSFGVYHFAAVGSTGALVKDSWARFCGVVTGLYTYTNAMNGTTHAVSIVGMFDLPENRSATAVPIQRSTIVAPRASSTSLGPSPMRF